MIRSMTGYGRAEVAGEKLVVTVEVRSLNHRHLDIALKLPRSLVSLEVEARRLIQGQAQRGRLDVSVGLRSLSAGLGQVKVDQALAREYVELIRSLAAELGVSGTPTVEWLMERPGVLSLGEPEPLAHEDRHRLADTEARQKRNHVERESHTRRR